MQAPLTGAPTIDNHHSIAQGCKCVEPQVLDALEGVVHQLHLWAPIDKEHSGVLPPRLQGVWLVDHAVELHVCTGMEVEDLRGYIVWRAT